MDIPNYQIHNVLRDYVRQLQRRMAARNGGAEAGGNSLPGISAPDKRRLVKERVTAEIVERIVHMDLEESRGGIRRAPEPRTAVPAGRRQFVYHVLTDACKLRRCRLPLESTDGLIRSVEADGESPEGD